MIRMDLWENGAGTGTDHTKPSSPLTLRGLPMVREGSGEVESGYGDTALNTTDQRTETKCFQLITIKLSAFGLFGLRHHCILSSSDTSPLGDQKSHP